MTRERPTNPKIRWPFLTDYLPPLRHSQTASVVDDPLADRSGMAMAGPGQLTRFHDPPPSPGVLPLRCVSKWIGGLVVGEGFEHGGHGRGDFNTGHEGDVKGTLGHESPPVPVLGEAVLHFCPAGHAKLGPHYVARDDSGGFSHQRLRWPHRRWISATSFPPLSSPTRRASDCSPASTSVGTVDCIVSRSNA